MIWLIILLFGFAGLHWVLLMPTQISIVGAAIVIVALWILWKLKWVILGVIGLEELFGGNNNGA